VVMDLLHFDSLGVKLQKCRDNSPAAISGMVAPDHRLVMIDDADVTNMNAEQVFEILKSKTNVKLCLKTQTAAQAYFDSKTPASPKLISSNELSTEVQTSTPPAISKAASMFGKIKSVSSFFSSNAQMLPASTSPSADPASIGRKSLVSFSQDSRDFIIKLFSEGMHRS
jgi:hypothetical protein